MKKMSEVFELPTSHSGEFIFNKDRESDWCIGSFDEHEQAQHASRAINHVDALADALEALLSDKAINHLNNKNHALAVSALVDYRGEK